MREKAGRAALLVVLCFRPRASVPLCTARRKAFLAGALMGLRQGIDPDCWSSPPLTLAPSLSSLFPTISSPPLFHATLTS